MPEYHALVIGINTYTAHGPDGWEALKTARRDAEEIADILEQAYGIQGQRLLDKDATLGAIMGALDGLMELGPGAAVLIYFAGHGFYDENLKEGYWIPADARKRKGGRYAKEDWIWNSTITKILGASPAQHVLVISDSCYGGALFRGQNGRNQKEQKLRWYHRAIGKPSRFLISSGDLEPIRDDGAVHSIFGQEVIDYLRHTGPRVFSASDLGLALREEVSALTGQLVRMGPLPLAVHAGGEFVFIRKGAARDLATVADTAPAAEASHRRADPPPPGLVALEAGRKTGALGDALLLERQGAPAAARRLLGPVASSSADDPLVAAVLARLDHTRQTGAGIWDLIKQLEERKRDSGISGSRRSPHDPKPRILACLGPVSRTGRPEEESLALLYQTCMEFQFAGRPGLMLVERKILEETLRELDLGASDVSDPEVRAQIGRFLPAGLLLAGEFWSQPKKTSVYLKLVDTETSQVLAAFSEETTDNEQIAATCETLASQIRARIAQLRPLTVALRRRADGSLEADIGRFHGLRVGMILSIVRRPDDGQGKPQTVGTATVKSLENMSARFLPEWVASRDPKDLDDLWLHERAE
ncbi:MAG: caspase family protein [Kiritimatiellae bacterium]|nr:caspase family protein [Kiritimatiellia bacterium]